MAGVTAVVAVTARSAVAAVAAVEKTWWSLLKVVRSCFSFFLSSALAFSAFSVFQSRSSVALSLREFGSSR
jgi:hypothetical protein